MPTLPTELISLVGSSLFAAGMKVWGKTLETRRLERMLLLKTAKVQHSIYEDVRKVRNRGFQWTRRAIALLAVFFVIVFPKLVSILYPHIAVSIGYPEWKDGFLFFSSSGERIKWVTMNGLTITPLDTHLVSAIIGLYFGGSLIKG